MRILNVPVVHAGYIVFTMFYYYLFMQVIYYSLFVVTCYIFSSVIYFEQTFVVRFKDGV